MSPDEAWRFVEACPVGILTTLRRSGSPVSLPVWFAPLARRIYVRGPIDGDKFKRVRTDDRVAFLCEDGQEWSSLRAVHFAGRGRILGDEPELKEEVRAAFGRRYSSRRPRSEALPDATRAHYRHFGVIEITPDERFLSWDNSKLGVESA